MGLFDRIGSQRQQPQNMQDTLRQLQSDPAGMAKQKGWNIPDNMMGNPQAMVQHLIQTGQVGGPMLQQVMPMIQRLTGGK